MPRPTLPPPVPAFALVLALLAASCAGEPPAGAMRPPPPDTRERIVLPGPGRDRVLAEMRMMMESVAAIVDGLSRGDRRAAAAAARASGAAAAVDMDPAMQRRLPPAFLELGMATHRGFDALADRLDARGTTAAALASLAEVTRRCTACHAGYRLDAAR